MSAIGLMSKCPICGEESPFYDFQPVKVWKDNKKRELFVCRRCASNTKQKKREKR